MTAEWHTTGSDTAYAFFYGLNGAHRAYITKFRRGKGTWKNRWIRDETFRARYFRKDERARDCLRDLIDREMQANANRPSLRSTNDHQSPD